jgi:hypothetical protein
VAGHFVRTQHLEDEHEAADCLAEAEQLTAMCSSR